MMNLNELSNQCASEIHNLIARISGECLHPDQTGKCISIHTNQGLLIFAVDKGVDTTASIFTIPIPTNITEAQAILNKWGNRPVCTGGDTTLSMTENNEHVLKNINSSCQYLGHWLVAWMHENGISLEEQVLLADHYAHFLILKGRHFTHARGNIGPRLPEVPS